MEHLPPLCKRVSRRKAFSRLIMSQVRWGSQLSGYSWLSIHTNTQSRLGSISLWAKFLSTLHPQSEYPVPSLVYRYIAHTSMLYKVLLTALGGWLARLSPFTRTPAPRLWPTERDCFDDEMP